ncbi:ORF28 [Betabaculovirus altermyunipunctae]|uniref:ORF28 n=1 Tax=Betabaculovirus altermyunipunctae TaxID=3051996 RepID=A0A1S5YE54_9BBAC|nr:ORF28 [Betabaculovirus altermyunipunctae]AQQ80295.1 ORF28 [Betabaculovirus altermyunipunctae]
MNTELDMLELYDNAQLYPEIMLEEGDVAIPPQQEIEMLKPQEAAAVEVLTPQEAGVQTEALKPREDIKAQLMEMLKPQDAQLMWCEQDEEAVNCEEEEEEEEEEDEEEDCGGGAAHSKQTKSFTMDDLMQRLRKAQTHIFAASYKNAEEEINYLVRKCEHRMSIRKRSVTKRPKKVLSSYVHVYCGKRSMGFYNNSFEKARHITGMVPYVTIRCGLKSEKEGTEVVRHIKKAAGKYLYKCDATHKKHMNVYKNKIYKCVDLIWECVQQKKYDVVYKNTEWQARVEELPHVESETSD